MTYAKSSVADVAHKTPSRRPRSVRRTTAHDSVRADGLLGPVTMVASGRDLYTTSTGLPRDLEQARVEALISYPERVIMSLTCSPISDGADGLIGCAAKPGFRRVLNELLPAGTSSLLYQLLDDVPTALLVSNVAVHAAGVAPIRPAGSQTRQVDLCAGWAAGGTMQQLITAGSPARGLGRPEAPPLDEGDDPLAWHELESLPPHTMRRVRRLDVWSQDPVHAGVEAFFRDLHRAVDGTDTVVHEYTVRATVDLRTETFTACEASFGALPWPECPAALGSAHRLVGLPVSDLRTRVRDTFVGASTCTHLNDTFRSLEDVPALLTHLRS